MEDKTIESVAKALNGLERKHGAENFSKIFKTITVDNGPEFMDDSGIEQSCCRQQKRTKVFYCHPYSSYERGSNENQNKMVRRYYPKGTSFEDVTAADIRKLEKWINNYPREIFNFKSSYDMLTTCLNGDLQKSETLF